MPTKMLRKKKKERRGGRRARGGGGGALQSSLIRRFEEKCCFGAHGGGKKRGGKKVQINILDLFQVIKQQSLITRSNNLPALITTAIVKCQSEKQYKQSVTLPINTVAIKNISDISASLPPGFFFFFLCFILFFCFTSGVK